MKIEIAVLCTLTGVAISIATFYLSRKKETKEESKKTLNKLLEWKQN